MTATHPIVGPSDVSLVITAHLDSATLHACLASVARLDPPPREVVVVVDGGCEAVVAAAEKYGFRTLVPKVSGVAYARNAGARRVSGAVLAFADSDVILFPDFVTCAVRALAENPGASAAFGSYDAHPEASGVVSQYRNLLHHFTHQRGSRAAQTFWAGCGEVRRNEFFAVGGFDATIRQPSVEDIDLGYRLRRAGYLIALDPAWQVRHLKRWRFRDLVITDIFRRAAPWTRLLLREGRFDDDLNLNKASRWSAALVCAAFAALTAGWWFPPALVASFICLAAVIGLNRHFYFFLAASRGWHFAAAAIPLHLLYFAGASTGFALECAAYFFQSMKASAFPHAQPMHFPREDEHPSPSRSRTLPRHAVPHDSVR